MHRFATTKTTMFKRGRSSHKKKMRVASHLFSTSSLSSHIALKECVHPRNLGQEAMHSITQASALAKIMKTTKITEEEAVD